MLDIVPPAREQADHGDRVGDVQQDDARRDHAVERRIAAQVQTAQHGHDRAAQRVRGKGYVERGVHGAQGAREGEAVVAGERPA